MKVSALILAMFLAAVSAAGQVTDRFAPSKQLTAEDVSKLEDKARFRSKLPYRKTTTNLISKDPDLPVKAQFNEVLEFAPPDSTHFIRNELVNDIFQRTEYIRFGNKSYLKKADDPWTLLEIKPRPDLPQPPNAKENEAAIAKAIADAADEDRIWAESDEHIEPSKTVATVSPTKTVVVKQDTQAKLNDVLTDYYEVTTKDTLRSGNKSLSYTMIKRIWINMDGRLAKTEFEYSNSLHLKQIIRVVYEYDPKDLKIEAPIK